MKACCRKSCKKSKCLTRKNSIWLKKYLDKKAASGKKGKKKNKNK